MQQFTPVRHPSFLSLANILLQDPKQYALGIQIFLVFSVKIVYYCMEFPLDLHIVMICTYKNASFATLSGRKLPVVDGFLPGNLRFLGLKRW